VNVQVLNKNTDYLTLFVPSETVTMSEDTEKSSIHIAPFSGKHFDWPVWREKLFMARAHCKGYKVFLTGAATAPADSVTIDVTTPEGKTQKTLRDANETAYEALVLLIDGENELSSSWGLWNNAAQRPFPAHESIQTSPFRIRDDASHDPRRTRWREFGYGLLRVSSDKRGSNPLSCDSCSAFDHRVLQKVAGNN